MSAQPPTPNHGMSPEQFQALTQAILEAMGRMHGGPRVTVTDPRLSALIVWVLGIVGSGVVGAAVWGANSLSELNLTVTTAVARQAQQDKILEDHEGRLRAEESKN